MNIDNTHLIKHNLRYKTADELVEQITTKWNYPVFIEINTSDRFVEAPKNFEGYILEVNDRDSLQEAMDNKDLISGHFKTLSGKKCNNIYINEHLTEYDADEMYLGKWNQTAQMCNWIRKFGMHIPETLAIEKLSWEYHSGPLLLQWRKVCYQYIKRFGAKEMITFCCNKNLEWYNHMGNGWTMEDFVSWAKKEMIYVDFSDLTNFVFPTQEPDYYKVFIYDDFLDLKALLG